MIRIGVIGAGYWGPLHVRAFSSTPGCRVTAVADVSAERREHIRTAYPGTEVMASASELIEGPVDAIVIATPARSHAPLALAALEAEKDVLVEKPLCTESGEGECLIGTAAARGRQLMVGHTFLYHAAVRALRELVESEALGRVLYIDSKRVNLGLHRKDVDVIWDLAAHDIAILRYLLAADPLDVSAYGASFHVDDVAEVAYLGLRFPAGVLANVHVSWLDPVKVRRMTVVGDRRMAVWDDLEEEHKLRVFDRGMERRPYHDDFGQWQVAYRFGEGVSVPLTFEEPLRVQAGAFRDAIQSGSRPLADGREGLAVVQILEAASRALRLNEAARPVGGV